MSGHSRDSYRLYSKHYEAFAERELTFKECRSLFKRNNFLFHKICDLPNDIKSRVMHNPNLKKQIDKIHCKINELKEELKELQTQYNGGQEPWL